MKYRFFLLLLFPTVLSAQTFKIRGARVFDRENILGTRDVLVSAGTIAAVGNVGLVVRNLSTAPPDLVQTAEAVCEQIYGAAGIRITWINTVNDVNWEGPDIVLRAVILPEAPPSRALAAFGTALRERQELLLYQDRIVRFGKILDLPAHVMFSAALVHEIGHLLLDSDDHTPAGIMRGEWGQDDLNAIRRGRFHFTTDQIRRMKVNLEKRSDTKAR